MRRVIFSSRIAVLFVVIMSIVALTIGCALLQRGETGLSLMESVTKDYQTAQKLYVVAQQAVRDAYFADLIDDARYLKFIKKVDAEATRVDNMIVTALGEAEKLKGIDQENKLKSILGMIDSLSLITLKAGGFKK